MRCRRLVEAANAVGGADNVTVLLARLIVKEKEDIRPEAPNKPPARSTTPGAEHVSTSIRATEASVPRPAQAASPLENSPEAKAQRGSLTVPSRLPESSRDARPPAAHNTAPAAPVSEPAKLSIWKWEIKWPWGHKTTSPTIPRTSKPEQAEALRRLRMQGKRNTPWQNLGMRLLRRRGILVCSRLSKTAWPNTLAQSPKFW